MFTESLQKASVKPWEAARPCEPLPLPGSWSSTKSEMPSQKKNQAWRESGLCRLSRMFLVQSRRLFLLAFSGLLVACGATPQKTEAQAPRTAETASMPVSGASSPAPLPPVRRGWAGAPTRSVLLRSQGLALELPESDVWNAMPRRGAWSGLQHRTTGSEIWVRHVAARRTVKVAECEAEARASFSLLRHGAFPDHERRLSAPSGYGGVVKVILPPAGGGIVEAYGVSVSRCLAVVFVSGVEAGFPERLQFATNQILSSLKISRPGESPGRQPLAF